MHKITVKSVTLNMSLLDLEESMYAFEKEYETLYNLLLSLTSKNGRYSFIHGSRLEELLQILEDNKKQICIQLLPDELKHVENNKEFNLYVDKVLLNKEKINSIKFSIYWGENVLNNFQPENNAKEYYLGVVKFLDELQIDIPHFEKFRNHEYYDITNYNAKNQSIGTESKFCIKSLNPFNDLDLICDRFKDSLIRDVRVVDNVLHFKIIKSFK